MVFFLFSKVIAGYCMYNKKKVVDLCNYEFELSNICPIRGGRTRVWFCAFVVVTVGILYQIKK
jgi:hypothetical protein